MRVHFILPGFAPRPIGGYKVVYSYANFLADRLGIEVVIHQSGIHWKERGLATLLGSIAASRSFKSLSRQSREPVPWFQLSPSVRVVNTTFGGRLQLKRGDVVVATAVVTAPYVARKLENRKDVAGVYFIQHYEGWQVSDRFVDATWRLPLYRIVIGPWLAEIAASLGVEAAVVPNAVDPSEFSAGGPIATRGRRVVGLYGENAAKRPDLLVQVFERLHETDPSIHFDAFGVMERPDDLPAFIEYRANPSRSDLAALYRGARVYICTSDAEGWGLPPAEATLSGAAVVSTRNGGVEGYAEDFALFADPGDSKTLADHAVALLDDEADAQRRVDRGRMALLSYAPDDAAAAFHEQLVIALERATA
jgi:glycosyltransferase involved in cell wall biosynthesis